MADLKRSYLDSCCFIDLAKQAIGALPTDRITAAWYLWKLLEANKDREVEIFTSTLSIAECTHADAVMDDRVRDLFNRFLMSGQYVRLVQPTPFLAADARDLRWHHGIMLRGADYIHVASAIAVKATELLTTDSRIIDQAPKIAPLGLRVVQPQLTAILPDKYRQEDMLDDKIAVLRQSTPKTTS
jgi:hypothetical protein